MEVFFHRENGYKVNLKQFYLMIIERMCPMNHITDFHFSSDRQIVNIEDVWRTNLPTLHKDNEINLIFLNTKHLNYSQDEIRKFFQKETNIAKRINFIKSAFNDEYTEFLINDMKFGYKAHLNCLYIWEGAYLSRTKASALRWSAVEQYFDTLHLYDILYIDEAKHVLKEEFPQAIIDIALKKGSNFSEGTYRILNQFLNCKDKEENIRFLKKEYGIGGGSCIQCGSGIGYDYNAKGIHLYKRYFEDRKEVTLPWNVVEKRISQLIHKNQYLTEDQEEMFRKWCIEKGIKPPKKKETIGKLIDCSIDLYENITDREGQISIFDYMVG